NFAFLIFGLLGAKIFPKILGIPQNILMILVAVLCFIGAYSIRNSSFDIIATFFFGLLGYAMMKGDIPRAPMILGLILGPIMEQNFQRSMTLSDGNMMAFFSRPLSAAMLAFALLILVIPIMMELYKHYVKRKSADSGTA
ncbi:MAG: tripartite tricarboxylate transporter permease, partial [Gracilibacteraceae bacterium]|nr:tripartite tricarboxylate transporter permease [Gracilibacteraceae bacterium]